MRLRLLYALLLAVAVVLPTACGGIGGRATPVPTIVMPKPAYTPRVGPIGGDVSLPGAGPTTLVVGNTGGDGVWIRRTPAMADRLRTWPDKTAMQVIGADQQAEGKVWKNVKDPAGNVGWIPAEYLVAAGASTAPRPAGTAAVPLKEEQVSCLRPSRAFAEYLSNGLNFPGGAVAGVEALRIDQVAKDNQSWYLVGAAILGGGVGKEALAYWATTIVPTGEVTAGTILSVNNNAKDLSVWPQPAQVRERFPTGDPDVAKVEQCLNTALGR
ncbi:MAG: hypothetical protein ACYC3S_04830 [Chloroflexota bacterium]